MATLGLDLRELRQAVADALGQVDGLIPHRGATAQIPTGSGDQAVVVVVYPDDPYVSYHESFGRSGTVSERGAVARVNLLVRAYVTTADWTSAQDTLDELASTGAGAGRSVFDALMVDRTLGGVVETIHVAQASAYRQDQDTGYLMAEWALTLTKRR